MLRHLLQPEDRPIPFYFREQLAKASPTTQGALPEDSEGSEDLEVREGLVDREAQAVPAPKVPVVLRPKCSVRLDPEGLVDPEVQEVPEGAVGASRFSIRVAEVEEVAVET
jgi:hypothetical protein